MSAFPEDLFAKLALYSIDAIADMIIWTDRDGRYVSVNKAAQRLLGFTPEEFRLRRVCDVDPLFSEAKWREHWEELERLGSVTLETVNVRKDGVRIPIEVTANMVTVDGMRFNCSIVRDITERRRNEAKLTALNERIYQMSITDGLTGIGNRRRFDEAFAGEVSRHARSGAPLSLLLIDIDHFKAFNDHYGHLIGDDCLRRVAGTIAATVDGSSGVAARFGGEEFACVLPGTAMIETTTLAERVRVAVTGLAIPHAFADGGVVTVSIGAVCSERAIAQTSNSLLAAADALLYRAKHEGRNRVVAALL